MLAEEQLRNANELIARLRNNYTALAQWITISNLTSSLPKEIMQQMTAIAEGGQSCEWGMCRVVEAVKEV